MKHKSALKRILHYIAGYRFYLAASLILAVLTVALTLYAPVLTGDAIDYMIGIGQVDFEALTALLIRLGVVVGATSLFQWLMNLCNNHMTYKVVMDVRTEAFDHMQDLPLSYIDSHPQGDIVSRLIADIDQFSDYQANHGTVIGRRDSQIRRQDRLLNGLQKALFPWLNLKHPRFGNRNISHLLQRRRRSIIVYLDSVQNMRIRPSCPDRCKIANHRVV